MNYIFGLSISVIIGITILRSLTFFFFCFFFASCTIPIILCDRFIVKLSSGSQAQETCVHLVNPLNNGTEALTTSSPDSPRRIYPWNTGTLAFVAVLRGIIRALRVAMAFVAVLPGQYASVAVCVKFYFVFFCIKMSDF